MTDQHAECRDFYVRWLDFDVVFEASWFVYLVSKGEPWASLAYSLRDEPWG